MPWYYAENGQQVGPVADEQFQSLVSTGVVRPDTLVWRDGMPNWVPYSSVASPAPAARPLDSGPDPAIPGGVVCAECRNTFAPDQVIRIADRNVCATCKPVLVQRLAEGATPAVVPGEWVSEDQLLARDYRVDIGSSLERAWSLFSKNAGPMIGTVLLVGLVGLACWGVSVAVGMVIPTADLFLQALYAGPLAGGLLWYLLRLARGENASIGDAFAGFSSKFVPLFLATLVQSLIMFLCLLPVFIVAGVFGFSMAGGRGGAMNNTATIGFAVGLGVAALIGIAGIVYITTLWTHSLLLIMDKNMKFWPAMQLSRKVVSKRWGMTFLLLLVAGMIGGAGALACFIGLLVTMPLYYGMKVYFYDDNFRDLQPAA